MYMGKMADARRIEFRADACMARAQTYAALCTAAKNRLAELRSFYNTRHESNPPLKHFLEHKVWGRG